MTHAVPCPLLLYFDIFTNIEVKNSGGGHQSQDARIRSRALPGPGWLPKIERNVRPRRTEAAEPVERMEANAGNAGDKIDRLRIHGVERPSRDGEVRIWGRQDSGFGTLADNLPKIGFKCRQRATAQLPSLRLDLRAPEPDFRPLAFERNDLLGA